MTVATSAAAPLANVTPVPCAATTLGITRTPWRSRRFRVLPLLGNASAFLIDRPRAVSPDTRTRPSLSSHHQVLLPRMRSGSTRRRRPVARMTLWRPVPWTSCAISRPPAPALAKAFVALHKLKAQGCSSQVIAESEARLPGSDDEHIHHGCHSRFVSLSLSLRRVRLAPWPRPAQGGQSSQPPHEKRRR